MALQLVFDFIPVGLIPMNISLGECSYINLEGSDSGCLWHDIQSLTEADAIDILKWKLDCYFLLIYQHVTGCFNFSAAWIGKVPWVYSKAVFECNLLFAFSISSL